MVNEEDSIGNENIFTDLSKTSIFKFFFQINQFGLFTVPIVTSFCMKREIKY